MIFPVPFLAANSCEDGCSLSSLRPGRETVTGQGKGETTAGAATAIPPLVIGPAGVVRAVEVGTMAVPKAGIARDITPTVPPSFSHTHLRHLSLSPLLSGCSPSSRSWDVAVLKKVSRPKVAPTHSLSSPQLGVPPSFCCFPSRRFRICCLPCQQADLETPTLEL